MAKEQIGAADAELTWGKVWKWVGILYALSLLGFLIKASAQMGGLAFQNVWQFVAVLSLPAIHMFWLALIAFIYLAFKKFQINAASGFLSTLGWIYVIFVVFRLISGRQI